MHLVGVTSAPAHRGADNGVSAAVVGAVMRWALTVPELCGHGSSSRRSMAAPRRSTDDWGSLVPVRWSIHRTRRSPVRDGEDDLGRDLSSAPQHAEASYFLVPFLRTNVESSLTFVRRNGLRSDSDVDDYTAAERGVVQLELDDLRILRDVEHDDAVDRVTWIDVLQECVAVAITDIRLPERQHRRREAFRPSEHRSSTVDGLTMGSAGLIASVQISRGGERDRPQTTSVAPPPSPTYIGIGASPNTSTLNRPFPSARNGCPSNSDRAASRLSASTIE